MTGPANRKAETVRPFTPTPSSKVLNSALALKREFLTLVFNSAHRVNKVRSLIEAPLSFSSHRLDEADN